MSSKLVVNDAVEEPAVMTELAAVDDVDDDWPALPPLSRPPHAATNTRPPSAARRVMRRMSALRMPARRIAIHSAFVTRDVPHDATA